jgi:hypothetical protein
METGFSGKGLVAGRQDRRDTIVHTRQAISILEAVNEADYRPEERKQSTHMAEEHKVVAGKAEEDRFGKQQA